MGSSSSSTNYFSDKFVKNGKTVTVDYESESSTHSLSGEDHVYMSARVFVQGMHDFKLFVLPINSHGYRYMYSHNQAKNYL